MSQKSKPQRSSLKVKKESLRVLDAAHLRQVVGGVGHGRDFGVQTNVPSGSRYCLEW